MLTVLPRADPRGRLPWPLSLCAPHQQCWGLWSITCLHKQSPHPPHSAHTHSHTHTHTHTQTRAFTSRAHAHPTVHIYIHTGLHKQSPTPDPTVHAHTHLHKQSPHPPHSTHSHTHTFTSLGPQTCLHRAVQGSPLCPHQGRSPRRGFLQEGHTAHSGATCPPGVGVLLSRPNQFNAACSRRVTSAGPAGFCTPSPPPPPPGESLGLVLTLER